MFKEIIDKLPSIQEGKFIEQKNGYNLDGGLLKVDQKFDKYMKDFFTFHKIKIHPHTVNANDLMGEIFVSYSIVNSTWELSEIETYQSNVTSKKIKGFKKLTLKVLSSNNNSQIVKDNSFWNHIKNAVENKITEVEKTANANQTFKLNFSNTLPKWPNGDSDETFILLKDFSTDVSDKVSGIDDRQKQLNSVTKVINFRLNNYILKNNVNSETYVLNDFFRFHSIVAEIKDDTKPTLTKDSNGWTYQVNFNYLITISKATQINLNATDELTIPASYSAKFLDSELTLKKI